MTAWAENIQLLAMEPHTKEQRNVIPSKEHLHGTKSWLMEAMMLYVAEEVAIAYIARLVMIGYTGMRVGTLHGQEGRDQLYGGDGDDFYGGEGNDRLVGGDGDGFWLQGGPGRDIFGCGAGMDQEGSRR
jgi:RTX calcium-binding nonapeptide repeat (4 copies)